MLNNNQYKEKLLLLEYDKDNFSKKFNELKNSNNELAIKLNNLETVNSYFNMIVDKSIDENKTFIENLVNKCLISVFGCYKIEILEKKNGTRIIRYIDIINTDGNISGNKESHGGGILAVISFIFKFIISYKFNFYPLMVFDEPFGFVSSEYRDKLSTFIKDLCKEFDYTILIISHEPEMAYSADVNYVFSNENGETSVREIKQ